MGKPLLFLVRRKNSLGMRNTLWIALAVSICTCAGGSWAQTSAASPEAPSAVSGSPSDLPDDQAFAQYQRVTKGIKPPKTLSAPDPKFPSLPDGAEQRGTVVMLIGVSPKGRVEVVRVLRSDEEAFDKTAITTVKKWKFKPAEKDGHPVPVQITVEMKFQK
jgi:TonB family protein